MHSMGELGSEARSGPGEAAEDVLDLRKRVHDARALRSAVRSELESVD